MAKKALKKPVAKKSAPKAAVKSKVVASAPKSVSGIKTANSSQSNMLLWIIFAIVVIFIGMMLMKHASKRREMMSAQPQPEMTVVTNGNGYNLEGVIADTTIKVPESDATVTLSQTPQNYTAGSERGNVTWNKIFAGLTSKEGTDIFTIVSVNRGGSGTQQYLVGFHVLSEQTQMNSFMIGDRVEVESISIVPGTMGMSQVTVNYLDRSAGMAMYQPATVKTSKTFTLYNHQITANDAQ